MTDQARRSLRNVGIGYALYLVGLAGLGFVSPVSWLLLTGSVALSATAFLVYGADKRAAKQGRWRTRESVLHAISLLGGWPGALAAQKYFRHKTCKTSFQIGFWITVVANIVGSMYLIIATAP